MVEFRERKCIPTKAEIGRGSLFFFPGGDGEMMECWGLDRQVSNGGWMWSPDRKDQGSSHRSGEEIHRGDLRVSSPINSESKECWNPRMESELKTGFLERKSTRGKHETLKECRNKQLKA
ncbi:hypothetical protein ATANTOWER_024195 [Ataeniobius toweri]|uniref:Uncharacterized protein n=1 Tax=Ataeniobius toweri TaxID=208326 RepID=A0ABU7BJ24_9TELE|nr:hypothetical protein [Ataeniobius toweri]